MWINGKEKPLPGGTLLSLLCAQGYDPARVAVERNGEIVAKAAYGETTVEEADTLEIVQFVGGG